MLGIQTVYKDSIICRMMQKVKRVINSPYIFASNSVTLLKSAEALITFLKAS